jgi:hypothetical protein
LAESKIPVLTEVYKPKTEAKSPRQEDPTLGITPELISRVSAHVRPRLEAEITQSVLESLSAFVRKDIMSEFQLEIKKTQEEIVSSTKDFVDRTKADLKTEMPRMYQDSIDLAQINLKEKFSLIETEAAARFDVTLSELIGSATQKAVSDVVLQTDKMEADVNARIMQYVDGEMQKFQQNALEENQALLQTRLESISHAAQEAVTKEVAAFQEQTIAIHQQQLNESLTSLQNSISEDAKLRLQTELETIQQTAIGLHQTQLTESLNSLLQISGERAEHELMNKMHSFQEKLQNNHQAQLEQATEIALQSIKDRIEESTQEQVDVMETQVGSIQQEKLAQLRETFNEEKTEIFNAAAAEIKTSFTEQMAAKGMEVREHFLTLVNGDLPSVQEVLKENIQQILESAIPEMEESLRLKLVAELNQLLLKVKFVLPDD